jgi:chloramphenicol 3-O-phosphotransferase
MDLTNISKIKLLKIAANSGTNTIAKEVNEIIEDGWVLLQIDTQASNVNGNGSQNYYVYHFGWKIIEQKEKKEI